MELTLILVLLASIKIVDNLWHRFGLWLIKTDFFFNWGFLFDRNMVPDIERIQKRLQKLEVGNG